MAAFNDFKIAFMGQTRRGKSTLLNALFGTSFKIDTIVECTTNINSSTFVNKTVDIPFNAITVMDTPGIGASLESDEDYNPYYSHVLSTVNCVVWVTNMQRTDSLDQDFFYDFKKEIRSDLRLVICINGIDKCSPYEMGEDYSSWDEENNTPTEMLKALIEKRKELIKEKFSEYINIPYSIVATNALKGYGLNDLFEAIFKD